MSGVDENQQWELIFVHFWAIRCYLCFAIIYSTYLYFNLEEPTSLYARDHTKALVLFSSERRDYNDTDKCATMLQTLASEIIVIAAASKKQRTVGG